MRRVAGRVLGLLLVLCATPVVPAQTSDGPQVLANRVRTIFGTKCVECHGADLDRPKGKFGYVLDLARVAANPKMITPGKPAQSELYQMVFHNEMPGKGAHSPPLTAEEKDVVKRWIEAGAPAADGAGDTVEAQELTLGRRLVRDIGQFHPLTTHFPIALLIAALPAELMWQRTRNASWKAVVRFCVALGAAGAMFAATLGWCDAAFSHFTGDAVEVLAWHRWIGTATAVWAALTAVLSELAHRRGNPRHLSRGFCLSLFVGIVLVSIAGHLGASLIYGLHYYIW